MGNSMAAHAQDRGAASLSPVRKGAGSHFLARAMTRKDERI
jgi:hypothetical protein